MVTRRQISAAAIAILIISTVGLTVLFLSDIKKPTSNLGWSVSLGDTFTYRIESYYLYNENDYNSTYHWMIAAMNNTSITLTITGLPSLPPAIDGEVFASDVINQPKTHCAFENGSELPEYCYNHINDPLSSGLLPTGDWPLMDWCYPNEVSDAFGPGVYISELESNYFFIGFELWPGDAVFKWSANTTLETGVPFRAVSDKNSISGGVHVIYIAILVS